MLNSLGAQITLNLPLSQPSDERAIESTWMHMEHRRGPPFQVVLWTGGYAETVSI